MVVAEIETDVALDRKRGILVLRPGQTLHNAVSAIMRVVPHAHADEVAKLVRTYLPHALDLDPPRAERAQAPDQPSKPLRWPYAGLAAAAVLAAVGFGIAQVGSAGPVAANGETPSATARGDRRAEDEAARALARVTAGSPVSCEPVGRLSARCTDQNGEVVLSEASVGPRSVVLTFHYGKDRVAIRVFQSETAARHWVSEPATREMFPSARVKGRYVVWSTSTVRLQDWMSILDRPADAQESLLGPLIAESSDLVTAYLVGTTGITAQQVRAAERDGLPAAIDDAATLVAVKTALGVPVTSEEEDALIASSPNHDVVVTPEPSSEAPSTPEPTPTPGPATESTPTPDPTPQPTPSESQPAEPAPTAMLQDDACAPASATPSTPTDGPNDQEAPSQSDDSPVDPSGVDPPADEEIETPNTDNWASTCSPIDGDSPPDPSDPSEAGDEQGQETTATTDASGTEPDLAFPGLSW